MFYCGCGSVCITPSLGMSIPGYFEDRKASSVRDDLFAKAIYLESGAARAMLIALDAINLNREDVAAIRAKLHARLDLPDEAILVHATHTHTGGPVWAGFDTLRNAEYLEFMTTSAATAALHAYESRCPAKFGAATGRASGIAFIRRFFRPDGSVVTNPLPDDTNITGPEGAPDETFTLFLLTDADENPLAFISNFGLHLDTLGGDAISADYAGALARRVQERFGPQVMSLFFTGPCGNINHFNRADRSTYTDPNNPERIADALFQELVRLTGAITLKTDPALCCKSRTFMARLRKPTAAQIAHAKAILSGEVEEAASKMRVPKTFSKMLLDVAAYPATETPIELSLITLDQAVLAAWPGEMFCDFGQRLRSALPGRDVMIAELCGGSARCYIPTQEAFAHGGYEPDLVDCLSLSEDCGNIIVAETQAML